MPRPKHVRHYCNHFDAYHATAGQPNTDKNNQVIKKGDILSEQQRIDILK